MLTFSSHVLYLFRLRTLIILLTSRHEERKGEKASHKRRKLLVALVINLMKLGGSSIQDQGKVGAVSSH